MPIESMSKIVQDYARASTGAIKTDTIGEAIHAPKLKPANPSRANAARSSDDARNSASSTTDWLALRASEPDNRGSRFLDVIAAEVFQTSDASAIGTNLSTAIAGSDWEAVKTIARHIEPETFDAAISTLSPTNIRASFLAASKSDDLSLLKQLVESASPEQLTEAFTDSTRHTDRALVLLHILNNTDQNSALQQGFLHKFDLDFLNSFTDESILETPLMHLAMRKGFKHGVLRALLDRGLDPDKTDSGKTPLSQLGRQSGQLLFEFHDSDQQKGAMLLEAGADINAHPNRGETPVTTIIRRLQHNGGYHKAGHIGRFELSPEDNKRAGAPIVKFLLMNGANPFIGQPTAEHAAYREQWYELDNPSDRHDYNNDNQFTEHIPVQKLLAPYVQRRDEFEAITDQVPGLIKRVKQSDWYAFTGHWRPDSDIPSSRLNTTQLKLINALTGAFEERRDWKEFLVYDMLVGDLRENPRALQDLPKDLGAQPYDDNRTDLASSDLLTPLKVVPMTALENIQSFVGSQPNRDT